ncbi:hypothetical protein J6590_055534 [Homalodisca vitripennis]|nr:hypothetical protein J6590_055534 [Homalodisca vitripennis]
MARTARVIDDSMTIQLSQHTAFRWQKADRRMIVKLADLPDIFAVSIHTVTAQATFTTKDPPKQRDLHNQFTRQGEGYTLPITELSYLKKAVLCWNEAAQEAACLPEK